jgi:hypothetical protein
MRSYDTNDGWFQANGISLKAEHSLRYLQLVMDSIKRCVARGGLVSVSNSLEKDIQ